MIPEGLKLRNLPGGHAPTPPSRRVLHALLCFTKYSNQVYTGTPLFHNAGSATVDTFTGKTGVACCHTNQIAQASKFMYIYVTTDSQLADFWHQDLKAAI